MVKELQALCLDIRVLDREGNPIELSELCRDDDPVQISRVDQAAIDEVLGKSVEDDSLRRSFMLEDEDGNEIEEEEDEEYGLDLDEAYDDDTYPGEDID